MIGPGARVVAARRRLDGLAVLVGRGDGRAVQGLHPLGAGDGGGQAAGDVGGHVRAAHRQAVHVHQRAAGEHRRRGRPAAHVDADAAEVHLVVLQRRQRRGEGRGDHAVQLQVRGLQAAGQGLEHAFLHGDDQQLQAQQAAVHAARVAHAALVVHRPADRQQVDGAPVRASGPGPAPAAMARVRSASVIGLAPSETWAVTTQLASWPAAVEMVTPETPTPAICSARSTAWAMASPAASTSTMAPALHAARLDIAHARHAHGAVRAAQAVRLHDEAADLGGAEVQRGDDACARAHGPQACDPLARSRAVLQTRHRRRPLDLVSSRSPALLATPRRLPLSPYPPAPGAPATAPGR